MTDNASQKDEESSPLPFKVHIMLWILAILILFILAGKKLESEKTKNDLNQIIETQEKTILLQKQFIKNEEELISVLEKQKEELKKLKEQVSFVSNEQGIYFTKLSRLEHHVGALTEWLLPHERYKLLPPLPSIEKNMQILRGQPAVAEKPDQDK